MSVMTGYAETGLSYPKFVRRRASNGYFWNTVSEAFEEFDSNNIADYGIVATEIDETGVYTADDPSSVLGDYIFIASSGNTLTVVDIATNIRWQYEAGESTASNPWNAEVENELTYEDAIKCMLGFMFGKSSGGGTDTLTFRDTGNNINRVVMKVDKHGNRSLVTLNLGG